MAAPGNRLVVGIGELLWDCFPDGRRPGGAPANVAWHAGQLGLDGRVVSRLGADDDGSALRNLLADRGMDLVFVQTDPERPTGRVTVDTTDPVHPVFTIHEDVAWDHLAPDPALDRLALAAGAVCFGTLAQRGPETRRTLYAFLERAVGALRVYDVNLRESFYEAAWIERSLRLAQVVKLNEDEVRVVGSLLDLPVDTVVDLGAALRARYGVRTTCVTRGAHGCVLVEDDEVVEVPGRAGEVVDAVGAGDAFTAGLIAGRLASLDLEATAQLANAVGAFVTGCRGAMPKLRAGLAGRWRSR